MKELIIVGASGFGKEVAWLVERINSINPTWNILGFIDDNNDLKNKTIKGYKVLGNTSIAQEYSEAYFVCAIGSARVRRTVINKLMSANLKLKFATLIDPSAIISTSVSIGEGTIICANSILTVDIEVGKHCIINLGCNIGHDVNLGDYITVYPNVNIAGNTKIESDVEIGMGSLIIQNKHVVSETIIGAGAVIITDFIESGTIVGHPGKIKR